MDHMEKLGIYFVYHNIYKRFNITFEQFLFMNKMDTWQEFIETHHRANRFNRVSV